MNTQELAQRIIDIDFYGARDAEATPEAIENDIRNNPEAIIAFLLDMIEEYQAPGK